MPKSAITFQFAFDYSFTFVLIYGCNCLISSKAVTIMNLLSRRLQRIKIARYQCREWWMVRTCFSNCLHSVRLFSSSLYLAFAICFGWSRSVPLYFKSFNFLLLFQIVVCGCGKCSRIVFALNPVRSTLSSHSTCVKLVHATFSFNYDCWNIRKLFLIFIVIFPNSRAHNITKNNNDHMRLYLAQKMVIIDIEFLSWPPFVRNPKCKSHANLSFPSLLLLFLVAHLHSTKC